MAGSSVAPRRPLPQGTVTFLFTDIEGSTRLLQRLGDDYTDVLVAHQALLRAAFGRHGGHEFGTQGDAFFVAFADPQDAVHAAIDAQRALRTHRWPHGEQVSVRIGIHTGEPVVIEDDYVGIDVHRAARICSAAHGGQVIVSDATLEALDANALTDVTFTDLGTHRLKDLDRAEHVFQLIGDELPGEFPPLRSARPPTNVPQLGALIGRAAEVVDLRHMVVRDEMSLVTVTGPGGIGKTRVAAAVALDALEDFPDGTFFVDLSSVRSAELVASQIAQSLKLQLDGDRPADEVVVDYINGKRFLLVLDNFEQVLEGALVVAKLLRSCSELTVLVTSRVLLSIGGEHEFPLAPLGVPEQATYSGVAGSEAAQLFVARAKASRPGFELTPENAPSIAEICNLLDGLPLAIELAAARIKLLSPGELVKRLGNRLEFLSGGPRDSPIRHRALRTTIDWSYDLLSQQERSFFRAFAVFSGGATLDAIEHVLGEDLDTLDAVASLVSHSLIRQHEDSSGEFRFSMLETIREYALELLRQRHDYTEVADRHARYYLQLAETANNDNTPGAITTDHDNMRGAMKWLIRRTAEESRVYAGLALRLATALGHYWYVHGHVVEGASWLERALSAASDAPALLRARALRVLGMLMEPQQQLERARELFEEALDLYRALGDQSGEARCLNSLGLVARQREDLNAAEELLSASISVRRQIGDEAGIAPSLNNLGVLYLDRRDTDRARQSLEEALQLARKLDNPWGVACVTNNLGMVFLELDDARRARQFVLEGTAAFVEMGDLDSAAEGMQFLAGVAALEGNSTRAARLAGAADSLRRELGIKLAPLDRRRLDRWLSPARADLGEERFERAWAEGAAMTSDQALDFALERPQSGG